MRIQGLGVIEDAVVELASGFTVVTGETGAGKTMVVTGLGLLFGGRADAGLVRTGRGRAVVEGRVRLTADAPAAVRAADAGAELDEDALLLSRTLSAEGRSRAHVGGRSAPVGLLADLADELIAVHGQTDQQRLLRPARQRASLDRYAGESVAKPLAAYAGVYKRLRQVVAELETITTRARERAQEADLLRFGLGEIEQLAPRAGEDVELAAETERLGHADALRTAATTGHAALLSDPETGDEAPDAVTLIGAARRAVEAVAEHDPALAALAERLGEVGYLVSDVATELASYAAGVDADPVRLALAEERRAALAGLTRKYGADIAEVLAWAERSALRLGELDGDDDRVGELAAERDALRAELADLAAELSAARHAAADRFGAAVTGELGALAMPHARVSVAITGVDDAEGLPVGDRTLAYGPTGVDDVELLLAPHPGAPPRPLNKGASGGELSRVMLAVEVVFAGADPVPTFVFDEVDAGVGGKAAVEVGRRLAMLARNAQVIVVTHLPQVAAFADRHLVVEKSNDGTVTRSGVVALDDDARVRELSRMLAGLEDSELGRAHAEELLETAASAKAVKAERADVKGRAGRGR
ncbi:DNA repair protein RecN [Yinghuangia seranimata]|uniref:DNA repair protein RecN n=1 Tax=Yinghuangia seranimata TaxID=408067 RepID=UPI00248C2EB3|nr:DNA repair protein RecN [Yinghuangia seranimata]MDI2131840.1 DNA repair protein RecN [Yinghuangia seranimata]